MHDDTPQDPFAGDPEDPAALLGNDTDDDPLTADEEAGVRADLEDLEMFRALLEPQGILGVAMTCSECGDEHYFAWDLLGGNLKQMLDEGRTRVHEPAYAPDPSLYVSWDYARGYMDGILDAADDEPEGSEGDSTDR